MATGISFRSAQFVIERTDLLLEKADSFLDDSLQRVFYLYRDKSAEHFERIKEKGNILKPRLKDYGGDQRSVINGRLKGVFFSVTLYKGQLPTISPYGDTRICIPMEALFNESTNLYFADFYCFGGNLHCIFLVLTKHGSDGDTFCQKYLPQFDPNNNKFLWKDGRKRFFTTAMENVWLEVLYTENISIDDLQYEYRNVCFQKTRVFKGAKFPEGGFPKNKECPRCNVSLDEIVRLREKEIEREFEEKMYGFRKEKNYEEPEEEEEEEEELKTLREHLQCARSRYYGYRPI